MSPEAIEILLSLGAAVSAGFIVGAERERRGESSFGGARTFPLYALTGAIGMLVGPWLAVALAIAVGLLLAIAYFRDSQDGENIGMSTEMAAVVTYAIGMICTARQLPFPYTDRLLLVGACATGTLGLLSLKRPIRGLITKVSQEDIYATAKLLALAIIILPVLPNQDMGPWNALNPRKIGVLVVLISGISFAGYVAIRALGAERGLGLTGLLGGLASSTAVTLSFSNRAKRTPTLAGACAVAIALASATMFPRMLAILGAVAPELVKPSAVPLLAAGVAGFIAAGVLYIVSPPQDEAPDTDVEVRNPFRVSSAVKFAALFTAVLLLSRAAAEYFEGAGLYLSAIIGGAAGMDAITLSLGQISHDGAVSQTDAIQAMMAAAASNTVVKIVLAGTLGGRRLGYFVAGALIPALVAGGVALVWANN